MRIVIPGGSGQVGHILAPHFHSQGQVVTVFSRHPRPAAWNVVRWDGLTPGPGRLLEGGFEFLFPDWGAAACDLVDRWRKVN